MKEYKFELVFDDTRTEEITVTKNGGEIISWDDIPATIPLHCREHFMKVIPEMVSCMDDLALANITVVKTITP